MTQTIQPRSRAIVNKPHKADLPIEKTVTKEMIRDLRSLTDELIELQKDLKSITKVFHNLCDTGTDYLQATQEATQSLASLIQGQEKGK